MLTDNNRQKLCRTAFRLPYGGAVVVYCLLCRPACPSERHVGEGRVFSVKVTLLRVRGKSESRLCFDVARSRPEGVRIFNVLKSNTVLPSNADEIVSDLIGVI